ILTGHQEADHADVDEQAVGERVETKPPLDAAARHVGHLVLAVLESVDDGYLDPARVNVELAFETEPPVLLIPVPGAVYVNRLAVQDQAPVRPSRCRQAC